MPDTPEDQPTGDTRPRSTSLRDPRQIRLVNRLRSRSSGDKSTPPPINKGMQRKIDLEEKFQERQKPPQTEPTLDVPPTVDTVEDVAPPKPLKVPVDLVLKSNLADALEQINAAASQSQESLRMAINELVGVKDNFIDLQGKRKEGQDVSAAMLKMTQGARSLVPECEYQCVVLNKLANQLALINVTGPEVPAVVKARHQQLTLELQSRINKADKLRRDAATQVGLMEGSCAHPDQPLLRKDGLADYTPDNFELVAMLKAGHKRFLDLTVNAQHEGSELHGPHEKLLGWFDLVSTGKEAQLPSSEEISWALEGALALANAKAKTFSQWNASIQRTWKPLDFQASKVTPPDTEINMWREKGGQAYNDYIRAYSQADETCKSIIHIIDQIRLGRSAPPTTVNVATTDMNGIADRLVRLQGAHDIPGVMSEPITRVKRIKDAFPELKSQVKSIDPHLIASVNQSRSDVMGAIEMLSANMLSLERGLQELTVTEQRLKASFNAHPTLKTQVSNANKQCSQLRKQIEPVLSDARKLLSGHQELLEQINTLRVKLGTEASPEETKRLVEALASLPPCPDRKTLFPGDESKQAHTQLGKGGDKDAAKLFGEFTSAWEAVEKSKSGDINKVRKLEATANAYLRYKNAKGLVDPVENDRAQRCTEALRKARQLLLEQAKSDLPPPPWTEAQATEARRIEACTLLNNGGKAKPPSGKGASDSFFIPGSDGKPAFIFKPQEGENVPDGCKAGEGVVREVLSYKLSEQMKSMMGIDFGVSPTQLASLESEGFTEGEKSQAKVRTGAMQKAIVNEGSLLDLCSKDGELGRNLPLEDVHKIALLDFLTLQGDRNVENILIRDEGGKKRLSPIDGGFAFPTKALFTQYSDTMLGGGRKDGTVLPKGGGAATMQLPQSDLPFTPDMLQAIEKIDPEAMVKGMKEATKEVAQTEPSLDNLVGDENLELMRRSAILLKKVAPKFTVAQISEIYALDFPSLIDVPNKQLEGAMAEVIKTAETRLTFQKALAEDTLKYEQLGGDAALKNLGWKLTDKALMLDVRRCIAILEHQEQAPEPNPQPTPPKPQMSEEQRQQLYEQLGGDAMLLKVVSRPDGRYTDLKLGPNSSLLGKLARLKDWKMYSDLGGDDGLAAVFSLFKSSRYTRFDLLDTNGKAAVIAMDGVKNPFDANIMNKIPRLQAFADHGGKL